MGSNPRSLAVPERFTLRGRFAPLETFTPRERFTPDPPTAAPYNAAVCTASMPAVAFYSVEGTQLTPASEAERARQTLANTMAELDRIVGLGLDWDSYGSAPPANVAVETARRLIVTVYRDSMLSARTPSLPYSIAPLSGGGIQFEWRGESKALEIEVSPEGALGYLLIQGAEPSSVHEEEDGVPESRILKLVRSVQR
jgi:hypothetical protein